MNLQRLLPYTVFACVTTAVIIASCSKDPVSPGAPVDRSTARGGGPATTLSHSAPVFPKAYVGTQVGLCEPGSGDSNINYFTASNGAGETNMNNELCKVSGVAENPSNNTIYVTRNISNVTYLDKINPTNGAVINLSNLWTDGTYSTVFAVEEIEFDLNGNMYLLQKGDNIHLYKIAAATINTPPTDIAPTLLGSMFADPMHRTAWLQTLCLAGTGVIYLSQETSTTGSTTVYSINLSTAAATSVASYPVPNPFTHNISSYYYNGNVYIIRDNGISTGTIYQLVSATTVNTLANQVNAGPIHDAFYGANYNP